MASTCYDAVPAFQFVIRQSFDICAACMFYTHHITVVLLSPIRILFLWTTERLPRGNAHADGNLMNSLSGTGLSRTLPHMLHFFRLGDSYLFHCTLTGVIAELELVHIASV